MSGGDMLAGFFSDLRYRFRAIFRRAEVERELDDELRDHLERETEKNARRGLDTEEASRRAGVAFGGVERVKDDARDARGVRVLEMVSRDLRYAIRGLRTNPGFTLAVVATLGLGIGANTAMFGVVDRLMFRPPAFMPDPASVNRVDLEYTFHHEKIEMGSIQYQRYLDLARDAHTIAQSAVFQNRQLAIGTGDEARVMGVAIVSASYFDLFDVHPIIGRFLDAADDSRSSPTPVVVLGNTLWRTRFGSRRDILGKQLQVGSLNATIIGVAPDGFVGVEPSEPAVAFIPATAFAAVDLPRAALKDYGWQWLYMLIRRKPDVGAAAAAVDLSHAFELSWESERAMDPQREPVKIARPHATLLPIQAYRAVGGVRSPSIVLWIFGVAGIVLLIACANVANLLLGRAFGRRREIAVRLALGVSRSHLVLQLLIETLLLALLAGLAGVAIGEAGQSILRSLFLPDTTSTAVLGDSRSLLFAISVALLAGILTGLAPALQLGRSELTSALKSGVREGGGRRSRTRNILLVAQGALSVFLLIGAGLFVRSLHNVASIKLGYDVDPILYVETDLGDTKLPDSAQYQLSTRIAEEARSLPGVRSASLAMTVPLYGMMMWSFSVPGVDSADQLGHFALQMGERDYFRTMGTRILRGRGFDSTDRPHSEKVVVISEGMAKKLWPHAVALGKCIKFGEDTMPCTTVIGIAENVKMNDVVVDEGLQYYLSIEQRRPSGATLFVRMTDDAEQYTEMVRKRLQPLMPGTSFVIVTPLRRILDPHLSSWRMGATMLFAFGILALSLAAIGLYSVIAYNVAQRTQELGLRIALGAPAREVLRMILGEGLRFGLAGIVVGALIALAAGHWVQPLLYGVSAHDPLVFVAVAAVLAIVAIAASAIPARRAMRLDPSIALRTE